MCNRIVAGGVLRNSSEHGGFRDGKFRYIFVKIAFGSCLNAEGILSEIDRVQIILEDLLFRQTVFELDGEVLFLHFSFQFLSESRFFAPVENLIFQKLLCERTGTLMKFSAIGQSAECRTENSLQIDSVVNPETFVFDSNESILQVLWNGIERRILTVCLFSYERLNGLSLTV